MRASCRLKAALLLCLRLVFSGLALPNSGFAASEALTAASPHWQPRFDPVSLTAAENIRDFVKRPEIAQKFIEVGSPSLLKLAELDPKSEVDRRWLGASAHHLEFFERPHLEAQQSDDLFVHLSQIDNVQDKVAKDIRTQAADMLQQVAEGQISLRELDEGIERLSRASFYGGRTEDYLSALRKAESELRAQRTGRELRATAEALSKLALHNEERFRESGIEQADLSVFMPPISVLGRDLPDKAPQGLGPEWNLAVLNVLRKDRPEVAEAMREKLASRDINDRLANKTQLAVQNRLLAPVPTLDLALAPKDIASEATSRIRSRFPGKAGPFGFALSPDGRELFVADKDAIQRYEVQSGNLMDRFDSGPVIDTTGCVSVSPDGGRLFAAYASYLWVFNLKTGQKRNFYVSGAGRYSKILWNKHNIAWLFSHGEPPVVIRAATEDGPPWTSIAHLYTYPVGNGTPGVELLSEGKAVFDVRFLMPQADGTVISLAESELDGRHMQGPTRAHDPFKGHKLEVQRMVLSPDKRLLFTASLDRTTRVWDFETAKELAVLKSGDIPAGLALSPDGKQLVFIGCSGLVKRWDLAAIARHGSAAPLAGETDYPFAISSAIISPKDGSIFAATFGGDVLSLK